MKWALLLALCFAAFFLRLGAVGLLEQDEPRYAGTARAMVRDGDWLVPEFNGRERLVKPPLTYWAIAASFRATGREDEGAARLPSAIAATLLVLLVAAGTRRALGDLPGLAAGVMLATSLQFLVQARLATTDMLFTLFFTAAAACWLPALREEGRAWPWVLASGVGAGLAGLVKTPLGILLPPLAALAAGWILRRRPRGGLAFPGAVVIFAGLMLAWLLPADAATGGRLWAELRHEMDRHGTSADQVHEAPPWYYLLRLPGLFLPWFLLLPAGVAAAWRRARSGGAGAALAAFSLAHAAVVLVAFSVVPSKLPSYALPLLPPMAVLAAMGLDAMDLEPAGRAAALGRRVAGWGGLALGAAVALSPLAPPVRAFDAAPLLSALGGLLAAGGMLALARRPIPAAAALALAPLSILATAPALLPRLEEAQCARGMVAAMRREGLREGDAIYDAGNSLKGVPWYADRATVTKPDGSSPGVDAVIAALASPRRSWAILEHDPEDARAQGERTQWERLLAKYTMGAPVPRIVFRGMGRLVATNAPPP